MCEELAKSYDSYADSVEQAKTAIKHALIELAAIVAVDEAFGWIAAPFTIGGSAAAAQGGMALAISIYGARIAAVIRALIGLTEAARVPVTVSQAIARGSGALIPLLWARPALAGYENRRILAEAQDEGLTQQELDRRVNSNPTGSTSRISTAIDLTDGSRSR
ncbi:hypothetical protein [Nocardia amamiensis]|uniref:hypothetical protein n=1 Tax=Nocardia amamiensis TaxID=404578 RepID=UPI00082B52CC|nr:hypothetical protein [Nocardia amamiensis]